MKNLKIAVLASGRGSNFQAIIDAIESGDISAEISLLITDSKRAFAIERAKKHGIEHLVMTPEEAVSRDAYYQSIASVLEKKGVRLIVLAGFMRVIGKPLIDAFPSRIMNIHPALLPSFPGLHGQRQACDYGVRISGCTVHFVDEGIDTGPIIMQAAVPVKDNDTEETLSERILKAEHKIYPAAIKLFAQGRIQVVGRKVQIKDNLFREELILSPLI